MNDLFADLKPYQKEILEKCSIKLSNGSKITIKLEDVKPLRGKTLDYIFVDNFEFEND